MHHLLNKEESTKPTSISHLAIVIISLVIIGVIILHIGAAFSLMKSGMNTSNLSNPVLYAMIALLVMIATFKVRHIMKSKHKKKHEEEVEL
jgi:uncharacterized membrane protein